MELPTLQAVSLCPGNKEQVRMGVKGNCWILTSVTQQRRSGLTKRSEVMLGPGLYPSGFS